MIVGDVTGKGIDAAALTALVRHTARTAARFDNRPGAVLAEVDRALREQPTLSPVTAVCARLDEGEPPRMTLAVGGHPLPLLKRDGQPPRALGGHGLLLGVVPDGRWEETVVPLSQGDTVLFFTDGVTEAPGAGGRFGDARLAAAVAAAPPDPDGLLGALRDALAAYTTGTATDDRAMLALRLESEAAAATATLSAEQRGSGAAPRAPQIRRMTDGARRPRALR